MLNFVFTLIIVCFSFLSIKRSCFSSILTPTIVSMAFISILFMHYFPSVYFLYHSDDYFRGVDYHWACALSLVMLSMGALCVTIFSGIRSESILDRYVESNEAFLTKADKYFYLALGMLCTFVFVVYVARVPFFPLKAFLMGGVSTQEAMEMRIQSLSADDPLFFLYGMARSFLMPILFLFTIAAWSNFRFSMRILGGCFIFICLLYNAWTGAKTPVAMLFLMAFFLLLIKRQNRISSTMSKLFSIFLPVVFIAIALFYPLLIYKHKVAWVDQDIFSTLVGAVFNRIFFTPAYLTYMQFELVPDYIDFTYFADIQKFATLMGWEPVNLSRISAYEISGVDSNAPPCSIGTFYAQGGWPVLLIGFFLVGVLLQMLQLFFIRVKTVSKFHNALIVILCFGAFRLAMTSFHTIFFIESIIPTIMIIFCLTVVTRAFK